MREHISRILVAMIKNNVKNATIKTNTTTVKIDIRYVEKFSEYLAIVGNNTWREVIRFDKDGYIIKHCIFYIKDNELIKEFNFEYDENLKVTITQSGKTTVHYNEYYSDPEKEYSKILPLVIYSACKKDKYNVNYEGVIL